MIERTLFTKVAHFQLASLQHSYTLLKVRHIPYLTNIICSKTSKISPGNCRAACKNDTLSRCAGAASVSSRQLLLAPTCVLLQLQSWRMNRRDAEGRRQYDWIIFWAIHISVNRCSTIFQ